MTQWWLARRLAWRLALVLITAVALAAVAVGWRAIVTARSLEDASLQAQVAGDDGEAERGQAARDRLFAAPSQFTPVSIGPVQSEPSFATRTSGRTPAAAAGDGRVAFTSIRLRPLRPAPRRPT